ncbi:unnamed protein product [Caretta caretta]
MQCYHLDPDTLPHQCYVLHNSLTITTRRSHATFISMRISIALAALSSGSFQQVTAQTFNITSTLAFKGIDPGAASNTCHYQQSSISEARHGLAARQPDLELGAGLHSNQQLALSPAVE